MAFSEQIILPSARHLRDIMQGDMERVSTTSMCGKNDPNLTFAIPDFATCESCCKAWLEESQQNKAKHRFRLDMHGVITGAKAVAGKKSED